MVDKIKVEAICIKDRHTKFPSTGLSMAEVKLEGFVGDVHSGFTRKADGRERDIERGTPIRNARQWSAVSVEELRQIANIMGLSEIEPWLLSANLSFSGIPNLTALPRGTQLIFEAGTILTVEGENTPCVQPGKEIAAAKDPSKTPQEFVKAALHKRGLVGVVHRAGIIKVGETATVVLP